VRQCQFASSRNASQPVPSQARSHWRHGLVLLAGLLLPYTFIHVRALVGTTVPLPLDLLALPAFYLPQSEQYARVVPQDPTLSDLILIYPFSREFAARELRQGRLPLWDPSNFCGAPFCWMIFSPFELPYHLFPTPQTLIWTQLLQNVVFGLGVYLFARRVLHTSFWPAAVGSWCAPLTGFLVLWQGYPLSGPVVILPWLLLATDKSVRAPLTLAPVWLAVIVAVMILSGALDITGQSLLVAAMLALWTLFDAYGKPLRLKSFSLAGVITLAAVLAGTALTGPLLLHFTEYAASGARVARRAGGREERPPGGPGALPQVAFPEFFGSSAQGSLRISSYDGNQLESAAAAYTGAMALLFLAPLALLRRAHRQQALFWFLVAVVGLGWCLNVPGLVQLLRLPGLNMFSHNRFTFATSFAVLLLAIDGLESLLNASHHVRALAVALALAVGLLAIWLTCRSVTLPEPLATRLEAVVRNGHSFSWIREVSDVRQLRDTFSTYYQGCAVLCYGVVAAWLVVLSRRGDRKWFAIVVSLAWLMEVLWFANLHRREADASLYYPPIAALQQLHDLPAGRILGVNCLPPKLNQTHHLPDVRGYDAVDPARIVELLELARAPGSTSPEYAQTQWFMPKMSADRETGEPHLPPVLDMLGVRYLIYRQRPPSGWRVVLQEDDYWIVENPRALDRVFVPRGVGMVDDQRQLMSNLANPQFDPRDVAFVEAKVDLPATTVGKAALVEETPRRVEITAKMETAGLVVLADSWHPGWQAAIDEEPSPMLQVNSALRGVIVPPGMHRLVFVYQPASFRRGLILASIAAAVLLLWTLTTFVIAARRRN
jgi:hypothetical protein